MTLEDRIAATLALLLASAREAEMTVTGDGRVSETHAAELLQYAPKYLAQMRGEGRAPRHFPIGVAGCRISYRLSDVAAWIEAQGEEIDQISRQPQITPANPRDRDQPKRQVARRSTAKGSRRP